MLSSSVALQVAEKIASCDSALREASKCFFSLRVRIVNVAVPTVLDSGTGPLNQVY